MGIQITNDPILILVTLYCHVYFGERRDWWRGLHCGNVPVKNNSSLLLFWKGNLLFHIFLFICGEIDGTHFSCSYLKRPAPSPQKSGGGDTQRLLGYTSAILSFLDAVTCHRNMFGCATGSPTTTTTAPHPPQKNVNLNLPRITCYILFFLNFMQLFIHNYKEFPNTHYSWLLSSLKTIPWGCWSPSVLPKAATRITLAA